MQGRMGGWVVGGSVDALWMEGVSGGDAAWGGQRQHRPPIHVQDFLFGCLFDMGVG